MFRVHSLCFFSLWKTAPIILISLNRRRFPVSTITDVPPDGTQWPRDKPGLWRCADCWPRALPSTPRGAQTVVLEAPDSTRQHSPGSCEGKWVPGTENKLMTSPRTQGVMCPSRCLLWPKRNSTVLGAQGLGVQGPCRNATSPLWICFIVYAGRKLRTLPW